MARSKQDVGKAQELAESLVPGTNVIARVKGYPAWPAVVVDENDVPRDVRKVRPSKKIVVPVLFYNDNSFLWIAPEEADPLSKEQALKNANAKIKRTLKDAYAMAADPPAYERLVAIATGQEVEPSRSEIENDQPESKEEDSIAEAPEQPAPRSRRARSAAERAQEQLPARARSTGGGRKRASAEPAPKPTPSAKKSKHAEPSDVEEDSEYVDNGTEETEESSTTSAETDGASEDLANDQGARFNFCCSVRSSIQESLFNKARKVTAAQAEAVKDALKRLDESPEIEISVVRRSKLVRVVYDALQLPHIPDSIKPRLEAWAEKWNTKAEPIIRGIPEELAPKEETEEPDDYDVSVDPSRDTTEVPESKQESQEAVPASNGTANAQDQIKSEQLEQEQQNADEESRQEVASEEHPAEKSTQQPESSPEKSNTEPHDAPASETADEGKDEKKID